MLKGYFGKDLYERICQQKFEGINLIRGFAENICGSSLGIEGQPLRGCQPLTKDVREERRGRGEGGEERGGGHQCSILEGGAASRLHLPKLLQLLHHIDWGGA